MIININFGCKQTLPGFQLTQLPLVHFYCWFCIERFSWVENRPAYARDCVLGSYVSVLRYLVLFWFYRLFCRYKMASKSKIIHNFTPMQQDQKPICTILATKQLISLAKFEILESILGKWEVKKLKIEKINYLNNNTSDITITWLE